MRNFEVVTQTQTHFIMVVEMHKINFTRHDIFFNRNSTEKIFEVASEGRLFCVDTELLEEYSGHEEHIDTFEELFSKGIFTPTESDESEYSYGSKVAEALAFEMTRPNETQTDGSDIIQEIDYLNDHNFIHVLDLSPKSALRLSAQRCHSYPFDAGYCNNTAFKMIKADSKFSQSHGDTVLMQLLEGEYKPEVIEAYGEKAIELYNSYYPAHIVNFTDFGLSKVDHLAIDINIQVKRQIEDIRKFVTLFKGIYNELHKK